MLACPVISLINWRRRHGPMLPPPKQTSCPIRSRQPRAPVHTEFRRGRAHPAVATGICATEDRGARDERSQVRLRARTRSRRVPRPVDGWRPAETEGNTSGGHYGTTLRQQEGAERLRVRRGRRAATTDVGGRA
jgi:hypothetical protein